MIGHINCVNLQNNKEKQAQQNPFDTLENKGMQKFSRPFLGPS